jgi:phage repressor protein C with HTH and peptisase S24 domain
MTNSKAGSRNDFVIDFKIMIKRIKPLYHMHKIKITSGNKNYDPIEINIEDTAVNGKVIWFAREIEG